MREKVDNFILAIDVEMHLKENPRIPACIPGENQKRIGGAEVGNAKKNVCLLPPTLSSGLSLSLSPSDELWSFYNLPAESLLLQ